MDREQEIKETGASCEKRVWPGVGAHVHFAYKERCTQGHMHTCVHIWFLLRC